MKCSQNKWNAAKILLQYKYTEESIWRKSRLLLFLPTFHQNLYFLFQAAMCGLFLIIHLLLVVSHFGKKNIVLLFVYVRKYTNQFSDINPVSLKKISSKYRYSKYQIKYETMFRSYFKYWIHSDRNATEASVIS